MLISTLISTLKAIQEKEGDREVYVLEYAQCSSSLKQPELRKHYFKPESETNFYVVIG